MESPSFQQGDLRRGDPVPNLQAAEVRAGGKISIRPVAPVPEDSVMPRVDDAVLPQDKKRLIAEVLRWYKKRHPIWFRWLEVAS